MQEQILKDTIEEVQKTIEQSQDWQTKYDMQVNAMLDNRNLFEEFKKLTKDYEHLQFYLNEVTQVDQFKVTVKYIGIDIATITISKDKVQITTEPYNKSNKELFNCEIQLKQQEEFNSTNTREFLEYFKGDIKLKNKPNKTQIESMLLSDFIKTNSCTKLLLGIQPIRHGNLYYQIPITINPKTQDQINILARTKVRKITIIETLTDEDLETVSANATAKAVFLTHLLHSEQGEKLYRLLRFQRKKTTTLNNKGMYSSSKIF